MNAISRILLPHGIHEAIPAAQYHAMPGLSASGIKTLIEKCPLLFRHEMDNPDDREDTASSLIGSAMHTMALEPHLWPTQVGIINASDYRTNAAKAERDAMIADGRTPILKAQAEDILAMGEMLRSEIGDLFSGGRRESTYRWPDPETGVEMKARPDFRKRGMMIDYKTTEDASPKAFQRRVSDNQHHIQAALYLEGNEILTGESADWLWVVQSTKKPFIVSVFRPSRASLYVGSVKVRAGIRLYDRCDRENHWPSYTPEPQTLDLPAWEMRSFEDREAAGEFGGRATVRPNQISHALSMAAQAPHGV